MEKDNVKHINGVMSDFALKFHDNFDLKPVMGLVYPRDGIKRCMLVFPRQRDSTCLR